MDTVLGTNGYPIETVEYINSDENVRNLCEYNIAHATRELKSLKSKIKEARAVVSALEENERRYSQNIVNVQVFLTKYNARMDV